MGEVHIPPLLLPPKVLIRTAGRRLGGRRPSFFQQGCHSKRYRVKDAGSHGIAAPGLVQLHLLTALRADINGRDLGLKNKVISSATVCCTPVTAG